jgi:hypothetical protein
MRSADNSSRTGRPDTRREKSLSMTLLGLTSSLCRNTRETSPAQVSVGVFQLFILVTVPQLTLYADIAAFIVLVLFHRSLAPILILRFFHGRFLLIN